jgi:hypothetical protein
MLSPAILMAFVLFSFPARAHHLDGLWRNDRQNITLRIESTDDGFRAKRIDQGIWYNYITKDGFQFIDRYGNYYTMQSDDDLIWYEPTTTRRIHFSKIENQWNENWSFNDRNNRSYGYNDFDHPYQEDPRHGNHPDVLNGRWMDTYRNHEIEIECFRDGIRVRSERSGWEKYYLDRYDHSYKDKNGNTIQLIDSDSVRWESTYGRHDRIYHRVSGYHNGNCR